MKDNILDFFEDVQDWFANFRMIQIVTVVVVLISIIGIVFGVVHGRSSSAAYEQQYQANLNEIARLNSELTALTNENNRTPDASDVEIALKSANTAGMAVAGLQTSYQDCVVNAGLSGSESYETAMQKNAEALDVYFDVDDKNARVPWFSVTSENNARLVWTFMTNYMFTSDSVECLWVCRDNPGNLVAFALGTYTASTNLFSDVRYYATAYGNKNYRTPEDPIPVYSISLADGSQTEIEIPDSALPPAEGWSFNSDGQLVNPDGEVYMDDDENWASNFEDAFKDSKAYRDYMKTKGDAMHEE